uniref:Peroxisomal membrane protein 11D-like n=1 Tax=Tanacetum cinerariifolium TaxID=118510 RepID=A0A6L2JQS5_TANCI|nr:peroxisomal membrane protein 11D-like [Tanacetum cinerariifolium]
MEQRYSQEAGGDHVLDDIILSDPEGEGHHETPLVRRVKVGQAIQALALKSTNNSTTMEEHISRERYLRIINLNLGIMRRIAKGRRNTGKPLQPTTKSGLLDVARTEVALAILYLTKADARDQICRAIQYGSEFPSNGEAGTMQNVDKASSLASRVFRLFKFVNDSHALINPTTPGTHLLICCGGRRKIKPLPAMEENMPLQYGFEGFVGVQVQHTKDLQQNGRFYYHQLPQNIAILFRPLNVTIEDVCNALLQGNSDTLWTELLASLLMMDPRINTCTLSAGFCMQRRWELLQLP